MHAFMFFSITTGKHCILKPYILHCLKFPFLDKANAFDQIKNCKRNQTTVLIAIFQAHVFVPLPFFRRSNGSPSALSGLTELIAQIKFPCLGVRSREYSKSLLI